jgi:hypothetical protein
MAMRQINRKSPDVKKNQWQRGIRMGQGDK